jgi:pilus assembly protein Flp/PilA
MGNLLKRFVRDDRGVSAMEYAILAGIVVVALVAVGSVMHNQMLDIFRNLFTKIKDAANS